MALNLNCFPTRGEGEKLFNLNFCACLFEGSFKSLSLSLRNFLFNCYWSLVNDVLSLFKSETCSLFNSLYNAKFSLAS